MTSDAQRAANRRNARHSTGPRTVQGKAEVSRNARRHGATAAPSPGSVATWVRVISGDPEAQPLALLIADRQTALALALAEAEARLGAAQAALVAHRKDPLAQGRDPEFDRFFRNEAEALTSEARQGGGWTQEGIEALGQLAMRRLRYRVQLQSGAAKRERLLWRYVREAQNHRNRVFADWIAYLAEQRAPAAPNRSQRPRTSSLASEKAKYRNKAKCN